MIKLLAIILFTTTSIAYSEQAISYDSLIGVWSYFHITQDSFSPSKLVGSEQRLIFQDKERVILQVIAKEQDYHQDTTYQLNYSLSLRNNVPYLSLFSAESDRVLGSYLRMPYKNSLEMSSDPSFSKQRHLYQRKDVVLPQQTLPTTAVVEEGNDSELSSPY